MPFRDIQITDLTCGARGAATIFPSTRYVLDIGAQCSRAIKLREGGKVKEFHMNEKCAAGSGGFLERAAKYLEVEVADIGPLSMQAAGPQAISSVCAVLAESEIINHVSEGVAVENILRGIHDSLADRALLLLKRVGLDAEVTFIGGVARQAGMVAALRAKLDVPVNVPDQPQDTAALGAALLDPDGVLWLGTLGNGLVRFDPKSPTARHFLKDVRNPASLGDNVLTAISPDNRGRMWIGHFSGLDIFDPHTGIFEHFSPNAADPLALKGSRVYSLYAHPQGAKWIGTYHWGVEYCDPFRNRFELLHHVPRRANQISAADVRAVLEDSEGAIWVGTSAGIDRIDPSLRTIQRFHPTPADQLSRAGSAVLSIFEDRQRTLWIGHADKGQLSRYRLPESVFQLYPIRNVRAIFEDRRGQMGRSWANSVDLCS